MIFQKGGNLQRNLSLTFQGSVLEIVKKCVYLGITFTTGGAFTESNRKAMNRNWCNQKANTALKTKMGNK